MTNQEILNNITKYTQAFYSDCTLYLSGDQLLSTEDRKVVAKSTLQIVESNLALIKEQLG